MKKGKVAISKGRAITQFIKKSKTTKIIAVLVCIIALLVYYFPRGVLEVSITDIYGEALPSAEVWIWDKDDIKGSPELVLKADSDGIARQKLFEGQYAVGLASEIRNEEGMSPIKYAVFLEIKKGKEFKLPLIKQE